MSPNARRRGRPSTLTPEARERILQALRTTTTTIERAAHFAGVPLSTFHNWCAKGREQKSGEYRDFLEAVEKARATRVVTFEAQIAKAGQKDWKAVAWLLERSMPKEYGQRVRLLVEEELTQAMARLKAALAEHPECLEKALGALAAPAPPSLGTGMVVDGTAQEVES